MSTTIGAGTGDVLWSLGFSGARADVAVRRAGLDSVGAVFGALGAYVRQDWARLLVALLFAVIVFIVLNLLGGPVTEAVVQLLSDDMRVVEAWSFGVRNLLIIPMFYVFAYGLVRPAFLASGA